MDMTIPTSMQVRDALSPLTLNQLDRLSVLSGVPATTIYKIKLGTTENPGIETVGKFFHLIEAARTPAPPIEAVAKVGG